jgi:OPA family glycerol-3-phosphate transporter-like MFS transporter
MTSSSAPSHTRTFRRWQYRIFALSWLSYASFYLCRVNLAVALPAIRADLGWDRSTVGLIGSVFLWIYALGQLINGALGQRARARWFVGLGMLVSAACNVLFGFSGGLGWMIVLWGLNGWVQSMGWGPIIKTVGAWFDPQRRGRIAALFSPCFVLGHLTAWVAGGWLTSQFGWRYAFWVPAVVLASFGLAWLVGIRNTPAEAGFAPPDLAHAKHLPSLRQIFAGILTQPRLIWAALTCVCASMIKDGLTLWAPTFLVDAIEMPLEQAALSASILPLFGLAGSMLAGWISDRLFASREAPGIMALSLILVAAIAGLAKTQISWVAIVSLGVCGIAIYGINSLLLTSLPLSFGPQGNIGAVAGFLDFASYLGGGVSALAAGRLLDTHGWQAVFAYWIAATLASFAGGAILSRHT